MTTRKPGKTKGSTKSTKLSKVSKHTLKDLSAKGSAMGGAIRVGRTR